MRRQMIAITFVALAGLGACGGSDSQAADDGPKTLADYMNADNASFREREAKVQEAVRDCMREQGFEYIPVDPESLGLVRVGPGIKPSKDFTARNGYGISTMVDGEGFAEQRSNDPNAKIREALPQAEREAYDKALFGNAIEAGADGQVRIEIGPGGPAGGAEPTGCMPKAFRQVHGDGDDSAQRQLMPKLEELENRIQADPRMVKALRAWSGCMADAGHGYATPKAARDDLMSRVQKVRDDAVALRQLQEDERAIANADLACAADHLDEVEAKVREELEAEFIEDNKGALAGASRS